MDSHFIYHNKYEHLENSIPACLRGCVRASARVCVYMYVCVCMYVRTCVLVSMNVYACT